MEKKKTMIIGASNNPSRYSYLVAHKLVRKGYEIINIGIKKGEVAGVSIETIGYGCSDVDTITLYVSPKNQEYYYDYILQVNPKRLIFNPGTENPILKEKAEERGIYTLDACTLVMINTGQY